MRVRFSLLLSQLLLLYSTFPVLLTFKYYKTTLTSLFSAIIEVMTREIETIPFLPFEWNKRYQCTGHYNWSAGAVSLVMGAIIRWKSFSTRPSVPHDVAYYPIKTLQLITGV